MPLMQRRFGTPRVIIALSLAGLAHSIPGCVSANDTHKVARAQAEAIGRISVESAITNAALIHATGALSSIRIERIASDTEASIITVLINPDGGAAHSRLDSMIVSEGAISNPLAAEVRETRMTAEEAHSWLTAYAEALQDRAGGGTRRSLLGSLHPVVLARSDGARLSAALRDRAVSNAMLLADAHALAIALLGASTSDPSFDALLDTATDSWKELLLENIEDAEEREALGRLIDSILDLTQLAPDTAGANP